MPDTDKAIDTLIEEPSKSAAKREMTALQALGESLVQLTDGQLNNIPDLDEDLRIAIIETRKIRSNSARKRHLQYIGKLMRHIDATSIKNSLGELNREKQHANDNFHALEQVRDKLLEGGPHEIEKVLQRWPEADRQQLRQIVLQHQRDLKKGKPPTAKRKLFKYLRELQESSVDD